MMQRIARRASGRTLPSTAASRTASSLLPRAAPAVTPIRALSTTASMSSAGNPFSRAVSPADAFQLLPESQKAGEAEDALYEAELKEVEAWWSSPRFAGIRRPYSAADVVSKRGSQKIAYPSSVMASKLFELIREREAKGEPIHTSEPPLPSLQRGPRRTSNESQWAPSTPSR